MSRAESPYLVDIHGGIVILNSDIQWYESGNLGGGEEDTETENVAVRSFVRAKLVISLSHLYIILGLFL